MGERDSVADKKKAGWVIVLWTGTAKGTYSGGLEP